MKPCTPYVRVGVDVARVYYRIISMTKRRKKSILPWLITGGLLFITVTAIVAVTLLLQDLDIAVLNPQGEIATAEKDLLLFTLALSAVVVVPVFVMIGAFAWRYREGNTRAKYTPDHDSSKWIEGLWWGIPIIIIGILSVVTWVSTHQLDPYKPLVSDEKAIRIQAIAMQWKWLFLYPDYELASVNVLKIPVGVPVNFEVTSDGPMSAMWIPSLGSQIYAMNGMTARLSLIADRSGEFRGSNSNINGEGFADMHFMVETVDDRHEFEEWAAGIRIAEDHDHMDQGLYAQLATPSVVDSPQYLHLHDVNLYDRVLNKYMHHGIGFAGGYDDHEH